MEELVLTLPEVVVIPPDLEEGVFVEVLKINGQPISVFVVSGKVMIGGAPTGYHQLPQLPSTFEQLHAAIRDCVSAVLRNRGPYLRTA